MMDEMDDLLCPTESESSDATDTTISPPVTYHEYHERLQHIEEELEHLASRLDVIEAKIEIFEHLDRHIASKVDIREKLEMLAKKISEIETNLDTKVADVNENLLIEIASDRKRLTKIENRHQRGVGSVTQTRQEVLLRLLKSNGGKMYLHDARRMMELSKAQFSILLSTMKDVVGTKKSTNNNKKKVIYLLDSLCKP